MSVDPKAGIFLTFPVYFHIFGLSLQAHLVMEILAYACGFRLYLFLRHRMPQIPLPFEEHVWLMVGCVLGAALGSKLLAVIESFHTYWAVRSNPMNFLAGKTIVGGLAGGWIGVEIVKRRFNIQSRTGDVFVFPIILAMCIGRIGCFLEGLDDHTYGIATQLPWGVDFGDGIHRHPTQLYEIAFFMVLGVALLLRARRPYPPGHLFRLMMLSYGIWRFAVEFIKPRETYLGLSPIQITSLLIGIVSGMQLGWESPREKACDSALGEPQAL
jgi:prolipoprotein diacylglyceryltransferase